ncbi:hypothetical protein FRC04_009321 [Tulasnella sp. 424]|nr:hypothetical protein FRC04_009321 [Tulasnella sp. 424]KAG8958241.1 hypothetical protein FRC05_009083 [Tulasnella sp. 425]
MSETLQKYTAVSRQRLKDYPIDCHDLVGSVRRLTPWTLVFEHNKPPLSPTPSYIKDTVALDKGSSFFVITHSSGEFSMLIMDTETNYNKVLSRAGAFTPQYTIRPIQQDEEPAPEKTFSSSPKISELADLQCYLKAYFYKICDDKIDELARERRMWREKGPGAFPASDSPNPKADKNKKRKPRRLKKKNQDPNNETQDRHGRRGTGHRDHPRGFEGSQSLLPDGSPLSPYGHKQSRRSETRKRIRSQSPPPRHDVNTSISHSFVHNPAPGQLSGRSLLGLANIAFGDALQVVLSRMPLLEELSNVEPNEETSPPGSSLQGDIDWIIPDLASLDRGIAVQLNHALHLRQTVEDPSDPRLAAYDSEVEAAFAQALERIRRAEED